MRQRRSLRRWWRSADKFGVAIIAWSVALQLFVYYLLLAEPCWALTDVDCR